MTNLSGKVALITGSARGIGKAIAERYASLGADVVVMRPELEHTHQCRKCGFVVRGADIDLKAISTGIITCPRCELPARSTFKF